MKNLKIEIPNGYEIDKEKSTFENIVFKESKKDIFSRIRGLQDAILELGENDEAVKQLRLLYSVQGLSRKIVAEQEIVVQCKALNEGWEPDFTNSSERKWFTYWDLRSGKPVVNYFGGYYSDCDFSARLCTKSEPLQRHLTKIAFNQFEEYIPY